MTGYHDQQRRSLAGDLSGTTLHAAQALETLGADAHVQARSLSKSFPPDPELGAHIARVLGVIATLAIDSAASLRALCREQQDAATRAAADAASGSGPADP